MNNPVWEWLIQSGKHAYTANEQFGGPDSLEAGPAWCFARFGQTSTLLKDGCTVFIGGEHEDWYDVDFYIYNDVIVRHPDGAIDIFGFPKDIFPPIDFHSATLIGDKIVLIGSLGYQNERKHGTTQILVLDLHTFAITKVNASGASPGWLHGHVAELSEDHSSILVRGGELHERPDAKKLVKNCDNWRLHLADWRWEKLTPE